MKRFSIAAASMCVAAMSALAPGWAQTTPAPSPQATAAASPSPSAAPPSAAPASAAPANPGKHLGQVKKLRRGSLSATQVRYALTHPAQEAAKLRKMHSVRFENLRVYKAPPGLLHGLHASAATVAYEPVRMTDALAQLSGLGSFLNIIANVNVQDALNNTLNGNTVDLSLTNVLNGNNIAIGQVVGLYIDSGGVITTIIK